MAYRKPGNGFGGQRKQQRGANMHLPQSLRDELVSLGRMSASEQPSSNGRPQPPRRQRQRVDAPNKRQADTRDSQQQARKKPKLEHAAEPSSSKDDKPAKAKKEIRKQPTALEKLLAKQQKRPIGKRNADEANEDAEIAWLEAKLGKTSKSEFAEDGLDDLFDELGDLEDAAFGHSKKNYAALLKQQKLQEPQSDDEEEDDRDDESVGIDDEALVHAAPESEYGESDEYGYESEALDEDPSDDEELSGQDASSSDDEQVLDESDLAGTSAEEEWQGIDDDQEQEQSESETDGQPDDVQPTSGPANDERTTDSAPTSTTGRYVPPHLRAKQAVAQEEIDPRLKKLLVSNLNKLSPLNIGTLLPAFESVYQSYPRAIVSNALVTLLLQRIQEKTEIGESFVASFAALIAILSRSIGGLREEAVGRAVDALTVDQASDNEGKQRKNIAAWLCDLYEFRVIAGGLIFGLVRWVVDRGLDEDHVEILLKIVKGAGRQIRSEDPTALKEIVGLVKKQVESNSDQEISLRAKFMLEQLTNLRNNKLPQPNDTVQQLKKFLSGTKTGGVAPAPLAVSLADIMSADKKGRWWLVGAAWAGDPLVDAQNDDNRPALQTRKVEDDKLAKIARRMGMNTDVRKDIFRVLMTSEDYVDACDRLAQLGLSEKQQREIARVLLQCSGNEKTYNPYYSLVANQLARKSRSFAITLQYCLWDLFREMGQAEVGGQEREEAEAGDGISARREANLSRFFGWCIAKEGLTLNVLKPVPFHRLARQPASFLTSMLSVIILSSQTTSPTLVQPKGSRKDKAALERICIRVIESAAVRNGLVLFLEGLSADDGRIEPVVKWGRQVMADTLRDGSSILGL